MAWFDLKNPVGGGKTCSTICTLFWLCFTCCACGFCHVHFAIQLLGTMYEHIWGTCRLADVGERRRGLPLFSTNCSFLMLGVSFPHSANPVESIIGVSQRIRPVIFFLKAMNGHFSERPKHTRHGVSSCFMFFSQTGAVVCRATATRNKILGQGACFCGSIRLSLRLWLAEDGLLVLKSSPFHRITFPRIRPPDIVRQLVDDNFVQLLDINMRVMCNVHDSSGGLDGVCSVCVSV